MTSRDRPASKMANGEAHIIHDFLAPLAAGHVGALGLMDDAAFITPPAGHEIVATMDAVAAGVHFFPDDAPADIGWKALAVNVSDLIAKGATPHAYLMSLAFPEPPADAWLAGFARGLMECQQAYVITLAGGDTDRRPGPLSVTITALGLVPTGQMVRRATAHPGDHIFVTGTLGDAALGLRLRAGDGEAAGIALGASDRAALVGRYLRPVPPLAAVSVLRQHASAAMDVSDGLVKDLGRMVQASGCGAGVDLAALPLSTAARAALIAAPSWQDIPATGGDDYQVLACVAPSAVADFRASAAAAGVVVTEIGRATDGAGVVVLDRDGRPVTFATPGYDHF